MVDTGDLKSPGGNPVTVRARSPVPNNKRKAFCLPFYYLRRKRARTNFNAARMSAAGEGLTEPLFDFIGPFSGTK